MPTKMNYIMIGIGALTALLLTSYVPGMVATLSPITSSSTRTNSLCNGGCNKSMQPLPYTLPIPMSIDNIDGIDSVSLNIARQKGLYQ